MNTCIAEEMGNGELCDVHMKNQKRISKRNKLIARKQGLKISFACKDDQSLLFAREQEVREVSEKKEGVVTCKPALVRKNRMG